MKKHGLIVVVGLCALLMAACGGTGTSEAVSEEAADQTDTGAGAPAEQGQAQAPQTASQVEGTGSESVAVPAEAGAAEEGVIVTASDGLALAGTFYPGSGAPPWPGVLLLHMLGSERGAWADVAASLSARGYASLAIDMRGHGSTGGAQDWTLAVDDLQRVWTYMAGREDVDESRTAVVGASIGSNMALITGAGQPAIDTVVLLSPGLDYNGVTTEDAMATYGARPVLIVASEEDTYAADSSRTLQGLAAGEANLVMYSGAGHGTNMFGPQPDLTTTIIDWLDGHLS